MPPTNGPTTFGIPLHTSCVCVCRLRHSAGDVSFPQQHDMLFYATTVTHMLLNTLNLANPPTAPQLFLPHCGFVRGDSAPLWPFAHTLEPLQKNIMVLVQVCFALFLCAGSSDHACHLRNSAATIEFLSLTHVGAFLFGLSFQCAGCGARACRLRHSAVKHTRFIRAFVVGVCVLIHIRRRLFDL